MWLLKNPMIYLIIKIKIAKITMIGSGIMTERKVMKTTIHPLASELIKVTSTDREPDFFKHQEIHLLSLLILYIERTKKVSTNGEMLKELRVLLNTLNTSQELLSLPQALATEDSEINEVWENDGFLSVSEGWEEQENIRISASLASVKNKLNKF